ncbi:MAG: flagellar motor switch protein FliN [Myxococcota bacterium]|nr:flagellar motor switch protein FliN [Myxococcota bacterium]
MNDSNGDVSARGDADQVKDQAPPTHAVAQHDAQGTPRSINFLLDIPLELTVEVGRRSMTMGELIELMPGTIIELDRPAGEQLDILANGKLVARGEAVVVGDRYGVRILEIVGDDPFSQAVGDQANGGEL